MSEETKKCPYCAEEIKKDAIYCRFCEHDLITPVSELTNQSDKSNKINRFVRVIVLVVFVIGFLLPWFIVGSNSLNVPLILYGYHYVSVWFLTIIVLLLVFTFVSMPNKGIAKILFAIGGLILLFAVGRIGYQLIFLRESFPNGIGFYLSFLGAVGVFVLGFIPL